MKGPCGYGRYDDDPTHVGCPRAQSDMTPCVARDGNLALADDHRCVGCNANPHALLDELLTDVGIDDNRRLGITPDADQAADNLRQLVREVTEPTPQGDPHSA